MQSQDNVLRLAAICSFAFLGVSLGMLGAYSWGVAETLAMTAFIPLSYLGVYGYITIHGLETENRRLKQDIQKKDQEIHSFIDKRKQLLTKMDRLQTKLDNQMRWADQQKKRPDKN
ncbi:hypothetical protein [Picosynechococcus sp. PCC 8807]|uniref:hypothetical protein n=1 Tax=Picosynechococcus sp. PCC 8807 TaxID=195248 RepID=UPI000810A953|nr:hypothetical protein [Picosynechococcus sp. PCC 8807]ANV90785.1 hypothetical protein AWQ24_09155 [Picosynechococcus sp. PCC 8807]